MKPYSVDHIRGLVEVWAPRLGLSHWEIYVQQGEPDSDEAVLEVQRHHHHHRAIITVPQWLIEGKGPDWLIEPITDEFVEQVVVHELGHLHFRDIINAIRLDCEELFGQVAYELTMRRLNMAEEQSVDLLARGLTAAWRKRS